MVLSAQFMRGISLEQLLQQAIQQLVVLPLPMLTEVERVNGMVDFYRVSVCAVGAVEFDLVAGLVVGWVAEVDELGHC